MMLQSKPENSSDSILFLDKKLLSRYRKEPRGVEIFNLNLIRDLAHLGFHVTVGLHATWLSTVDRWFSGSNVELLNVPETFGNIRSGFSVISQTGRRKFDVLLLGNVGNRLILPILMLRMGKAAPRCVLIAHRPGTRRFLLVQKLWDTKVIAVNKRIANSFKRAGFKAVTARYGVTEADLFGPNPGSKRDKDVIDFCVLGHLDNPWKGGDTAVAAFMALPERIRNKARLHLASFHNVPDFGQENIIAYSWMPFTRIPDFLRKMDVMLVPSRDSHVVLETFCQSMVQGMLTGLPVISSSLPILTEKLDRGGGIIAQSLGDMTEAMQRLADNPAERVEMGDKARATALDRYVWDTEAFVKEFISLRVS